MIRFVEIAGQIDRGMLEFAWFDTITDTFLEFGGDQIWETWTQFAESFWVDNHADDERDMDYFKRLAGLYPSQREGQEYWAQYLNTPLVSDFEIEENKSLFGQ
jgi:hypothetical protein